MAADMRGAFDGVRCTMTGKLLVPGRNTKEVVLLSIQHKMDYFTWIRTLLGLQQCERLVADFVSDGHGTNSSVVVRYFSNKHLSMPQTRRDADCVMLPRVWDYFMRSLVTSGMIMSRVHSRTDMVPVCTVQTVLDKCAMYTSDKWTLSEIDIALERVNKIAMNEHTPWVLV